MASQPVPKLSELAALIAEKATYLECFLDDNNLPHPSFVPDGPSQFPVTSLQGEASAARFALIDAAKDLRNLVTGPKDTLRWIALNDHNLSASLQAVYHFRITHAVPLNGEISFADLATKIGVDEMNLTRIVRMCETERIFAELRPGFVSHSAASKLLATDAGTEAAIGHLLDGAAFPSSARMVECLEKFKGSQDPKDSPFAMTYGAPMFAYMAQHVDMGKRFALAMAAMGGNMVGKVHMVQNYGWASLGNGLVVDIGGSAGHISIAIASAFPDLHFQVQDMAFQASAANAAIEAAGLSSRVTFVPHDFFTPQPKSAKGAAAYVMRYILHDWSDEYARKILTNIVAAMALTSRIIIADAMVPPPGMLSRAQEKTLRAFDMSMFIQLNARERAAENWRALLASVDSRLKIISVKPPPLGISVAILEVMLVEP